MVWIEYGDNILFYLQLTAATAQTPQVERHANSAINPSTNAAITATDPYDWRYHEKAAGAFYKVGVMNLPTVMYVKVHRGVESLINEVQFVLCPKLW